LEEVTRNILKPELNPIFSHFERMYRIDFPMYIRDIVFDHEGMRADIFVDYHNRATFLCPCGQEAKLHCRMKRSWRASALGSYATTIHVGVPRVRCPKCGVRPVNLGWGRERSRVSIVLEDRIFRLAHYMPAPQVADFLGVGASVVTKVVERRRGEIDWRAVGATQAVHLGADQPRRAAQARLRPAKLAPEPADSAPADSGQEPTDSGQKPPEPGPEAGGPEGAPPGAKGRP
jgi:hypothetical protein